MAKTRLAVKVAAWWTIPVSSYCMSLLKSVPLEQNRIVGGRTSRWSWPHTAGQPRFAAPGSHDRCLHQLTRVTRHRT